MIYHKRDIYNRYADSIILCPNCNGKGQDVEMHNGRPQYYDDGKPVAKQCAVCAGGRVVKVELTPLYEREEDENGD